MLPSVPVVKDFFVKTDTSFFLSYSPLPFCVYGPDSNTDNRSLKKKLGRCDFTLAFILLSNVENSYIDAQGCLPNPNNIVSLVRDFTSWMIWGRSGENESLSFFPHSTELALILFMHGQYTAVEVSFNNLLFLTLLRINILASLYFLSVFICLQVSTYYGGWTFT